MKRKILSIISCILISSLLISTVTAETLDNTQVPTAPTTQDSPSPSSEVITQDSPSPSSETTVTPNLLLLPDPVIIFWHTAASVGDSKGYTYGSELLYNAAAPLRTSFESYTAYPKSYSYDSGFASKIISTRGYKEAIEKIRQEFANKSGILSTSYVATVNPDDNADVFLALHNFTVKGTAKKPIVGSYYLTVTIYDCYNFDYSQASYAYSANLINDLVYASQNLGKLSNFSIYVDCPTVTLSDLPAYPGFAIRYGQTGYYVTLVKTRLNQLGFNCCAVDGSFGPATLAEVKSFQSSRGLAVDGSVGPITWNELFK